MRSSIWRRELLSLSAAVLGCGGEQAAEVPPHERSAVDTVTVAPSADTTTVVVRLDTVATGLEVPWDVAFAPDGRIFVTERAGRIRVIENGRLRESPWATLPVYANDPSIMPESGLMGIALAPDFAASGQLYVAGTFWKGDSAPSSSAPARAWRRIAGVVRPAAALPWEGRVYRLTDRGGTGAEPRVVVGGLPANYYHAGGAVAFGPDGMLYVTVGDVLHPPDARRRGSLAGKVLRYDRDGRVPPGNPFAGSPVYALGLRNTQALAWHPRTGELFGADHGPTGMPQEGGRRDRDELNALEPGGDYGWPEVAGLDPSTGSGQAQGADRFRRPLAVWTPAITPSGMAWYTGPERAWSGALFLGGLRGQRLTRLTLARDAGRGWRVVGQDSTLLAGAVGRIRALRMGPDGFLYVTTSNRDGRGTPRPGDDLLLRVVPVSGQRPRS